MDNPLAQLSPAALPTTTKVRALWGLAAALAVLAFGLLRELIHFQPPGVDFLPLWTAGRMAWSDVGHVYDFAAVSRAQDWLLPHLRWMRPYAYPPTALLLLAPFGAMPFWTALTLWLIASLGLFVAACLRLVRQQRGLVATLAILSPAVMLAVYCGQTALIAAALMVLAVSDLRGRPRRAGLWFALAAALKPQALLLAPVALVASGAFETLAAAAVIGVALGIASVACFGLQRWVEWLSILGPFQTVVETTPGLLAHAISSGGVAFLLGLTGLAGLAWRAAFGLFGLGLVWRTFRKTDDTAVRLAALTAGSLLATPYAMPYDAAILIPAALAIAVSRLSAPGWIPAMLALCAVSEVTTPGVGLVCVAGFGLLSVVDPAVFERRPSAAPAAA